MLQSMGSQKVRHTLLFMKQVNKDLYSTGNYTSSAHGLGGGGGESEGWLYQSLGAVFSLN